MAGSEVDSELWQEAKETIKSIKSLAETLETVIEARLFQPSIVNSRFLDGAAYHLQKIMDRIVDDID